ncbi:MAG: OmpA family protein [Ignavibacteriaceae bacterium]|nr:OmpA family protein [Ignavibacteriaceae bacterium]
MKRLIYLMLLFLMTACIPLNAQSEVPGAEDHKLISRYPGSLLLGYDVQEYDRYKIAIGPVTGYRHIDDWLEVEGKVTRIYYALKSDRSVTEVFLNYQNALKKNGFEILAEGYFKNSNVAKTFGGRAWLGVYHTANQLPTGMDLLVGSATSSGSAFVAGKLNKNDGTAYVAVSLTQYSSEVVRYVIDIIEVAGVEDDFIEVNAEVMKNKIDAEGKIALYGIYFDTDKATLKPESAPTIKEIVTLLKNNSKLNVYIVGHTDMTGSFDHNMSLSEKRAKSVVTELVNKHGIAASRLTGKGAGPLAPISSNKTEAGKKLNRRVELVGK